MKGVNKAILIGHVGKDPDIRYTPDGKAVANFNLATSEKWKDKVSGETRENTEWHRCVAWERLAEIVGKYVKKGNPLYVEGKICTRKWQDKSGVDRYTTEIKVTEIEMLGGSHQPEAPSNEKENYKPPASQAQQADFDDDIPF